MLVDRGGDRFRIARAGAAGQFHIFFRELDLPAAFEGASPGNAGAGDQIIDAGAIPFPAETGAFSGAGAFAGRAGGANAGSAFHHIADIPDASASAGQIGKHIAIGHISGPGASGRGGDRQDPLGTDFLLHLAGAGFQVRLSSGAALGFLRLGFFHPLLAFFAHFGLFFLSPAVSQAQIIFRHRLFSGIQQLHIIDLLYRPFFYTVDLVFAQRPVLEGHKNHKPIEQDKIEQENRVIAAIKGFPKAPFELFRKTG